MCTSECHVSLTIAIIGSLIIGSITTTIYHHYFHYRVVRRIADYRMRRANRRRLAIHSGTADDDGTAPGATDVALDTLTADGRREVRRESGLGRDDATRSGGGSADRDRGGPSRPARSYHIHGRLTV